MSATACPWPVRICQGTTTYEPPRWLCLAERRQQILKQNIAYYMEHDEVGWNHAVQTRLHEAQRSLAIVTEEIKKVIEQGVEKCESTS